MTREELIQSAAAIPPAGEEAAAEYAQKRETLVARVNEIMLSRSDIHEIVGRKNIDMMKDNHQNHARFIESILNYPNAEVLADTIYWVFRAYRSRGFHSTYWAAQLNAWVDALRETLSPAAFESVYPVYNWMVIHIPAFTRLSDKTLKEETVS